VFEAPRKKRNTFAIWERGGEGSIFGKVLDLDFVCVYGFERR